MRAYITGIAGFLGSHLADYLLVQGHEVWGCDDLSTGDIENLSHKASFDRISIEELARGILDRTDVVYHCAAAAYEGASVFAPRFISQNIYAGSAAVFSAAIAAKVKRIVFTSSMARYGEPNTAAFVELVNGCVAPHSQTCVRQKAFFEEQPPRPVDPYGIAKEAAERLLINLCETHGVEWSIAVPHNIYGPRQRYVDPYRNVAAIFANLMLQGRQPYIYGNGHQVRCFSYVDDVVPTLARMGTDPNAQSEIINVGPDEGSVTIKELGYLIAEIVGLRYDPIFLPGRPCEVKHAVCSSQKARDLLGFEPRTSLSDGLIKLVDWVRERGPRPFEYHLALNEIKSGLMPRTWVSKAM